MITNEQELTDAIERVEELIEEHRTALHDVWWHDKVDEALADTSPSISHEQVMDDVQTLIDLKRHNIHIKRRNIDDNRH